MCSFEVYSVDVPQKLSDPVRVKQAMVKVDGDDTPPFFGLGGFQIIILMSFVSKIFF